jgi:hypothetical protein
MGPASQKKSLPEEAAVRLDAERDIAAKLNVISENENAVIGEPRADRRVNKAGKSLRFNRYVPSRTKQEPAAAIDPQTLTKLSTRRRVHDDAQVR